MEWLAENKYLIRDVCFEEGSLFGNSYSVRLSERLFVNETSSGWNFAPLLLLMIPAPVGSAGRFPAHLVVVKHSRCQICKNQ